MQKIFPKEAVLESGKFMLGILVGFLAINFFISLIPLEWFEQFYASGALEVMKLFGKEGSLIMGEPVMLEMNGFAVPFGFSYLCTGILELSIVWATIMASFGIKIERRILGALGGALVLVLFNFFRIIMSMIVIIAFGMDAGNFSHDLLFRLFLFVTIAGYYYLWFKYETGREKNLKKDKKVLEKRNN